MFSRFPLTALSVLSALLLNLLAAAQSRADLRAYPMPSAGLVVLPETNLRLTDRNQADYDYGRVNSLDTAQMEHTFTLRNDGAEPVTITQLQPSCHCTLVTVEKIADRKPTDAESASPTLLPGLEMSLRISVQLAHQPPGSLSQGVYIYALGHDTPVARLHINADLANGLSIAPSALDFGSVKIGETKTQAITITFDNRLASNGNLPAIETQTDPREHAERSLIKITPTTESVSSASANPDPNLRSKTFLVTVRPEHTGDITARLYFTPSTTSTYNGTIPYDTAMDVFRSATVSIFAKAVEK